jgi:hypothetical protein
MCCWHHIDNGFYNEGVSNSIVFAFHTIREKGRKVVGWQGFIEREGREGGLVENDFVSKYEGRLLGWKTEAS